MKERKKWRRLDPVPDHVKRDYMVKRMFTASFGDKCRWCLGVIEARDPVAFIDDELGCASCVEKAKKGERLK